MQHQALQVLQLVLGVAGRHRFELDHIIPLALGGHPRNSRNLMLQVWSGHDGAKRKDRLEVKLQS